MNKKGNIIYMILFFVVLFLILFAGFMMVVGSSIINYVMDIAAPELSNLGVIGAANMTEIASYTITPLNNLIQAFTWLTGVLYVMMLIGSFGVVFLARGSTSKWLIGFYVAMVLLLILGAIFMSNIYEDFYNGSDDFSLVLKEHVLLSWMILYSPAVFTVIAFLVGVLLFSGINQEEQFV